MEEEKREHFHSLTFLFVRNSQGGKQKREKSTIFYLIYLPLEEAICISKAIEMKKHNGTNAKQETFCQAYILPLSTLV